MGDHDPEQEDLESGLCLMNDKQSVEIQVSHSDVDWMVEHLRSQLRTQATLPRCTQCHRTVKRESADLDQSPYYLNSEEVHAQCFRKAGNYLLPISKLYELLTRKAFELSDLIIVIQNVTSKWPRLRLSLNTRLHQSPFDEVKYIYICGKDISQFLEAEPARLLSRDFLSWLKLQPDLNKLQLEWYMHKSDEDDDIEGELFRLADFTNLDTRKRSRSDRGGRDEVVSGKKVKV